MKRTSISLPDDLATALDREARRRGESISEVTRLALATHLRLDGPAPRPLPFAGAGRSGERNVARDAEEILRREWGDARGS